MILILIAPEPQVTGVNSVCVFRFKIAVLQGVFRFGSIDIPDGQLVSVFKVGMAVIIVAFPVIVGIVISV